MGYNKRRIMLYFIKKYLRDIFTSIILIISLAITIFCSFNVSKYINAAEENKGDLERLYNYTMRVNEVYKRELSEEELEKLVKRELSDFEEVVDIYKSEICNIICNKSVLIDNSTNRHSLEIVLYQNEEIPYELISGSFDYSNDELVVYIGKDMRKYIKTIEGKEYMEICGYNFKVAGIIQSSSVIDYSDKILVFYDNLSKALDSSQLESILGKYNWSINICSNISKENINNARDIIAKRFATTDYSLEIYDSFSEDTTYIYISKLFGSNLSKLSDILCIINVFIILNIWIKQKHKEFAIRKAFGFSNIRILMNLLYQFLKCFVISILLGLGMQFLYNLLFHARFKMSDYFSGSGGRILLYIVVILFVAVIYHVKYISTIETKNGLSDK